MRLRPSFETVFSPVPPYDFEKTVHKPAGWELFTPFEVWENGVLWTAAYLGERLCGLRLSSSGTTDRPRFKVGVFAAGAIGPSERKRIRDLLASKLAVNDDLGPFYKIARRDPILRHAVRHLRGMHSTDPAHLFAEVVLAISLHMAPMKRSEDMMECFVRTYGGTAEFDGRAVAAWPTARAAASIPERGLRSRCRMGFRAKYILACARMIARGFPEYEAFVGMSAEEAREKLLELPGIGDYSVDILNPHGGFPIDSWSADVFGVLFTGRAPKNGREAIARIKAEGIRRWGKMAWLAFFYVVQDLPGLSEALGIPLRLY